MKAIWKSASFVLAVCVLAATPAAVSQQSATPSSTYRSCPTSNAAVAASVHAAPQSMPYLNLCDGHMLGNGASVASAAKPISLASGDFDEDGTPDLVSGFASGKGGSITVHRGNVRALWAYGADLRNGPPPAFFPEARTFSLPEAPDFIVTGDFDADGHWDIVTGRRGSNSIYLLKGDGHGSFRAAKQVALGGNLTAMITGEINRRDGLADLIVGVTNAGGAQVQVYESPLGRSRLLPRFSK